MRSLFPPFTISCEEVVDSGRSILMKSLPSVSVIVIVLSVSFAGLRECMSQWRGWGFGVSVRSNTMKMSGRQNTTCRVKFLTWPLGYAFAAWPQTYV